MSTPEYAVWAADPTPDNMSKVVAALDPIVTSEVQRYSGPKPLLRSKAKELTVQAIKRYDPASPAKLHSWVITNLQPLSRYGQSLRPVHASEDIIRQAAELHRNRQELALDIGHDPTDGELSDHVGISTAKITKIRKAVPAVLAETAVTPIDESGEESGGPALRPSNTVSSAEDMIYASLTPRERAIFDMKTGKHGVATLSNQDIARRLGVTPAFISQQTKSIADRITTLSGRGVE